MAAVLCVRITIRELPPFESALSLADNDGYPAGRTQDVTPDNRPRTCDDVNRFFRGCDVPGNIILRTTDQGLHYFGGDGSLGWPQTRVDVANVRELTLGQWLATYSSMQPTPVAYPAHMAKQARRAGYMKAAAIIEEEGALDDDDDRELRKLAALYGPQSRDFMTGVRQAQDDPHRYLARYRFERATRLSAYVVLAALAVYFLTNLGYCSLQGP